MQARKYTSSYFTLRHRRPDVAPNSDGTDIVAGDEGPYYDVELDNTGTGHLVVFLDSIEGLEPGDEIGVFDANGVIETCDMDTLCSEPTYGEVLVGAATWTGGQTEVSGVMSIEVPFGGPVLNGAVEDNPVVVKVWKAAEEMEYTVTATWSAGDGYFGEMILAISEFL